MTEVIGVRFKQVGKIYYFSPNGVQMPVGEKVIVETARGIECGEVAISNRQIKDEGIVKPLKTVIRVANKDDLRRIEENKVKEKKAFKLCLEKIEKHKLQMKLVDVEYTFDNNKILFYFTADGRVDFRELVKDLAGAFHIRIELRQVGIRDETKLLGGIAPCGRVCCCAGAMPDFRKVSIKMAKVQGLSLNPGKISGLCGRLMCCLSYENDYYSEIYKKMPKMGAEVGTPDGKGTVVGENMLKQTVRVKIEKDGSLVYKDFPLKDVRFKSGKKEADDKVGDELKDILD